MRRPGEMSISEAAERLEIHEDTVRRWVLSRLYGDRSKLSGVRRDAARRYWVLAADIEKIANDVALLNSVQRERATPTAATANSDMPASVSEPANDLPRPALRTAARK